jgi:hypothetical protein
LANLYYGGIPPNSAPGTYVKALVKQVGRYSSFFCLAGVLSDRPWSASQEKYPQKMDNCSLFPDRSDETAVVDNFINSHFVMASLCKGHNIRYIAGLQPICGLWLEPRWQGEENQSIQPNKNFVKVYSLLDENLNALAKKEGFTYLNLGKILAKKDNIYNFSDVVHLTDISSEIIAQCLGEVFLGAFSEISLNDVIHN